MSTSPTQSPNSKKVNEIITERIKRSGSHNSHADSETRS